MLALVGCRWGGYSVYLGRAAAETVAKLGETA